MTHVNEQAEFLFRDLGISPKLLASVERHFKNTTPIQHQVIPAALDGKDVVGIAQTGTGKTLAFGIPLIQRLAITNGQGLILIPTRELALQVEEELQKIGRPLGLHTAVIIGGASMDQQVRALKRKPHIIVATPGRLVDHLEQKHCSLDKITFVVLDEADRMLDIGFMPQIKRIMVQVPKERQTLLFSATMPRAISEIASAFMRLPIRIEVAPAGTPAANVEQEIFILEKSFKMMLLEKILAENEGTVLIFSRTKHGAKKIMRGLQALGHTAAELHSNRSLSQRREALDGFKAGKYRILVATDIAARGIDVKDIALVINFDLPDNSEDYVHRIGRTGRAGKFGKAVSFATPDQRADIRQIEKLISKTLPIAMLPASIAGKVPSAAQMYVSGPAERPARGRGYTSRNKKPFRPAARPSRPATPSSRPSTYPSRNFARPMSPAPGRPVDAVRPAGNVLDELRQESESSQFQSWQFAGATPKPGRPSYDRGRSSRPSGPRSNSSRPRGVGGRSGGPARKRY